MLNNLFRNYQAKQQRPLLARNNSYFTDHTVQDIYLVHVHNPTISVMQHLHSVQPISALERKTDRSVNKLITRPVHRLMNR